MTVWMFFRWCFAPGVFAASFLLLDRRCNRLSSPRWAPTPRFYGPSGLTPSAGCRKERRLGCSGKGALCDWAFLAVVLARKVLL